MNITKIVDSRMNDTKTKYTDEYINNMIKKRFVKLKKQNINIYVENSNLVLIDGNMYNENDLNISQINHKVINDVITLRHIIESL